MLFAAYRCIRQECTFANISSYFWVQMGTRFSGCIILLVFLICAGCANITAPTGGRKDTTPPKLVSIEPGDSLRNTKVKRIELYFNEYITVNDPTREVQLSPLLTIQPTVTGLNKHVVVKIVDSLLEENTTYRLSFGNSIKDLHEGNAFANYTYTFSTGGYFDSLELRGNIVNAKTGIYDLDGVNVVLYYTSENDTAVARHKPKYVAKADATGNFLFKGLPKRPFRIYALKDANENLMYDGAVQGEMIGFLDSNVVPGAKTDGTLSMRIFTEIVDTAVKKSIDSVRSNKEKPGIGLKGKKQSIANINPSTYSVALDTSNAEKKTFDITGPIKVSIGNELVINKDKITLSYDSGGVSAPVSISFDRDTVLHVLKIKPSKWRENTVYVLRLMKGFAKDTAGADMMPSRYTFRTKEEYDYGEITVHLPSKYQGNTYLLRVMAENDSIYQKPVMDTIVKLNYLNPAKYTMRVIVDNNHDGKWNTGDLLAGKQPEEVIPYKEQLNLRAGFKHIIDFEQKPSATKPTLGGKSPK